MLLFDPSYNRFSSSIENQDHKIVGIAALAYNGTGTLRG